MILRKYIKGYINDELTDEENSISIANAEACVFLTKYLAGSARYLSKPANKCINRVRKAFAGLTDDDIKFLDLDIELVREMSFGTSDACIDMDYALKHEVALANKSLSRKRFTDFATMALKNNWIEHNSDLVQVLKILMEEAGVSHDANAIAIAKSATDAQ